MFIFLLNIFNCYIHHSDNGTALDIVAKGFENVCHCLAANRLSLNVGNNKLVVFNNSKGPTSGYTFSCNDTNIYSIGSTKLFVVTTHNWLT